jgi:2-oxoglutarate dehydrogenase E1 component
MFDVGTFFQRLILEGGKGDNMVKTVLDVNGRTSVAKAWTLLPPKEIKRVVFCSGKIFYHLYHARTAAKLHDITLIRLEQIAPFPYDLVGPAIASYPNAEVLWVQEEPKNMGAWAYVKPRFDTAMRENGLDRSPIR